MDWLWPIYRQHLDRLLDAETLADQPRLREAFMRVLRESTATLYVMEPIGDGIVFRGLGQWPLAQSGDLLVDPNAFLAERFGGGKYKVNFHHGISFVGTHNFRAYGEEKWRDMEEIHFD